jgi:hypothetical protein
MKIISEGVLVLASAKGLENEYRDKEFDFDFPNGISKLLNENIIIALTTSGGDNLIVDFSVGVDSNVPFDKVINQFIKLNDNDDLLILSHADFTQICSKNGDLKKYGWPIQKLEHLDSGIYSVSIKIENIEDRFDEYQAYFRLTIEMNKYFDGMDFENEVFEITY